MAPPDIPFNRPWMHSNSSSTSLKGMEIAIPPGQALPQRLHPSPSTVTHVDSKPLPPIPLRRSVSSSFSNEVNEAFQVRTGDVMDRRPNIAPNWYRQEADISVMLEGRISQHQKQPLRCEVDSAFYPMPGEIISPQPMQPFRKAWQGKGIAVSASSSVSSSMQSSSPSGHNPAQKIRQLTGLEMHSRVLPTKTSPPAAIDTSSSSSVYSLEVSPSSPQGKRLPAEAATHVAQCLRTDAESPILGPPIMNNTSPGGLRPRCDGRIPSGTPVAPLLCRQPCAYCQHLPKPTACQHHHGVERYQATAFQEARHLELPLPASPGLFTEPRKAPSVTRIDKGSNLSSSSMLADLTSGFADRVVRSRVRMAPPTELSRHKPGVKFGTGHHPLRTPYPPRSVFEDDNSDGDGDQGTGPADPLKRVSSSSSALVGRWLRRGSGLTGAMADRPSNQGNLVMADRSRRAYEPEATVAKPATSASRMASDLLHRTGEQAKGLVTQAMRKVHVRSKAERRRDELRSKIRVVSEADAVLPGTIPVDSRAHGMETRHWL